MQTFIATCVKYSSLNSIQTNIWNTVGGVSEGVLQFIWLGCIYSICLKRKVRTHCLRGQYQRSVCSLDWGVMQFLMLLVLLLSPYMLTWSAFYVVDRGKEKAENELLLDGSVCYSSSRCWNVPPPKFSWGEAYIYSMWLHCLLYL